MLVNLAYGRTGLKVELPDDLTTVIEPTYVPSLPDQEGAIRNALRNPLGGGPTLRRLVKPGQTVAISVCDVTRPMPSSTVLPVLLRELAHVPSEQVTIMIATGTHRPNTPEELDEMLGPDIARNYRIVNHSAFDTETLEYVGESSSGIPVWLDKAWLAADVRITTGFVEPHFFAGFSGGPKMVAPGLAGFDTIMQLHNAERIAHPMATWGVIHGNPIHDDVRDIAAMTGVDFSVDVTINRNRKITSVYAGDLFLAHEAACRSAKSTAMQQVESPFDVVVTTNSGYPLDQNLYQAVKGMSAAAKVVKEGGTIVCAAECSDGIPDHGQYKKLLTMRDSPEDLLDMILTDGHNVHDQWQVQLQAQIQLRASVYLKSGYLSPEQVREAHLTPIDSIEDTVAGELRESGNGARVCVLPEGPQTIPYVA
ncbi:MAG: nickel-dependent lactate racemase [Dehalococcoidia bacterium]|nr:nickel-dependent lactate racemase [Dehalococcoidia bacterium]